MRLSKAIRLGAAKRPQAFGTSFSSDGCTCALGAALDGIGQLFKADGQARNYTDAVDYFPLLHRVVSHTQEWDGIVLLSEVRERNDFHRWTREAIADWIEQTFEQPQAEAVPMLAERA